MMVKLDSTAYVFRPGYTSGPGTLGLMVLQIHTKLSKPRYATSSVCALGRGRGNSGEVQVLIIIRGSLNIIIHPASPTAG